MSKARSTKKSIGERFEEKVEPAIGEHMHRRFQAMRDCGSLTHAPEPKEYPPEGEEGCGNPDCPVHGENKGEMPPPEVIEKMKELFEKVQIRNVEHETCIYVTDGEHSFKCYEMSDVEPMLTAFCAARGLDKENFTATSSEDKDFTGALQILREGNLRLFTEDSVSPLRVKMVRNDEHGFFVVLEK